MPRKKKKREESQTDASHDASRLSEPTDQDAPRDDDESRGAASDSDAAGAVARDLDPGENPAEVADAGREENAPTEIDLTEIDSDKLPAKAERRSGSARRSPMLRTCEEKLDYVFTEPQYLQSALTHASGAPYRLASNERMEFLGDAILGMIVCELLYHRYPKSSEGDLTKIKSVVVSRQTCARVARRLGLDEHLVLGKGMTGSAKLPTSLLAGVFESLVAAIYLDGGMEAVRGFVERTMADEVDVAVESEHGHNFKSLLQQLAQRVYNTTPTYTLLDERGPDHRKSFLVSARIGVHEYDPAWGANKKEAEQKAAQNALEALETASKERESERSRERQPVDEEIVKEHAIEPAEESASDQPAGDGDAW